MFVGWVLSLLVAAAPPGRDPWRESEEAGRARYALIAEAIVDAVEQAKEPMFAGGQHRQRAAALLAAVAYAESGLRVDVDTGSTRGKAGECSLWQIMPTSTGECDALTSDRRVAARVAYRMMVRSRRACVKPGVSIREMLSVYASGSCVSEAGKEASRARVDLAMRWFSLRPPPIPAK